MTVVYIDSLFLLNFIVDYLLLLATAKLAGEVICRPRLALGAAVGALYASAVFFPGMGFLTHPLCKLSAAIVMVGKEAVRQGLIDEVGGISAALEKLRSLMAD